jgi:fused signal recognition particle receptor
MSDTFPITIYHNPKCGTSRNALAMIAAAGYAPSVVEYVKAGWTRPQLEEILAEIKAAYKKDKSLHGQEAAKIGAAVLKRVLAGAEGTLDLKATTGNPVVIAMIGVNGSGKTTTSAKLAWKMKEDGKTVVLAACDTFRAAAVEQLKSWATRLNLEIVSSHTGADSAAVAFDA